MAEKEDTTLSTDVGADAPPTLVQEVQGDLFSAPPDWCLAHCVSRDLHMGKGIAVAFRRQFGRVAELRAQNRGIGQVAYIEQVASQIGTRPVVFYLITKEKYWGRPTYESLRATLQECRSLMVAKGLNRLAIPAIGCGLDRLQWSQVRQMLEEEFEGSGITIKVFLLKKP